MILYTANNAYIYLSHVTFLVDELQETVFTLLWVLWSRHNLKSRQLINNLIYLFRFVVLSNISCQNNPCKHSDNHKYACHVFDILNFCKSPHDGLCVSCDSHYKHVVFPLTKSTSFTCKGCCVLCELKTNIFIYYLAEYGANPVSPRIDSLLSLFSLSSTLLTFIASILLKMKKEEILLKLLATVIRSQKLLEWFPLKFNT